MSSAASEPSAPPTEAATGGKAPTIDDVQAETSRARARDREHDQEAADREAPEEERSEPPESAGSPGER